MLTGWGVPTCKVLHNECEGGHKLIHATENKKNVLLLNFRYIFSSHFSDLCFFFSCEILDSFTS